MRKRTFLIRLGQATAALSLPSSATVLARDNKQKVFPSRRPPVSERSFHSDAVEQVIADTVHADSRARARLAVHQLFPEYSRHHGFFGHWTACLSRGERLQQ